MVFGVEDHCMKPARVLGICCGAYPTRLVPNVAKLSGRRDGLLFYKRSDGIPNACGVKRPPYGSGKVGKEMKVSAHVLNHRLGYLVLKPECYHSSGSLADVNDGGRPIPATGVLGAGLPEEINLLTQVKVKG
jgi:hypothetical protein